MMKTRTHFRIVALLTLMAEAWVLPYPVELPATGAKNGSASPLQGIARAPKAAESATSEALPTL